MPRALAVAGVMGAGTALVFWAAYLAAVLLPSDRLVWQPPATVLQPMRLDGGPVPIPIDPNDVGPFQPWRDPTQPGPILIDPAQPPVIIERSTIEG